MARRTVNVILPPVPVEAPNAGRAFGYARVSSNDQDLGIQLAALKAAGCETVRAEKASATTTEGRSELATLLDFLRAGDVLVVTRIDRLARSIGDLATIVRELESKGVALRATEQPVDTSTATGKAFLGMLGVFAEFETNIRRERQLEGIAKAKAEGVYKGRPATIKVEEIQVLHAQKVGATEIAKRLGIGRASVYRVLGKPSAEKSTGVHPLYICLFVWYLLTIKNGYAQYYQHERLNGMLEQGYGR